MDTRKILRRRLTTTLLLKDQVISLCSTEYSIVSCAEGDCSCCPDSVAHIQTLPQENNKYIIMTNFDWYWHDIREWSIYRPKQDGKHSGFGNPREERGRKMLSVPKLTPEVFTLPLMALHCRHCFSTDPSRRICEHIVSCFLKILVFIVTIIEN